jgi:hypothetical protein
VRIAAVAAGVSAVTLIGTLTLAAPGAPPGPSFGNDPAQCATTLHMESENPQPRETELLPPMDLPRPLVSAMPQDTTVPSDAPTIDPTIYPSAGDYATEIPQVGGSPSWPATPDPTIYPPAPSPDVDPSRVIDPGFLQTAPPTKELTCFLVDSVHRAAPRATARAADGWVPPPMVFLWDNQYANAMTATTTLHDSLGYGRITVTLGLTPYAAQPSLDSCAPDPCTIGQGPHGEHVETYTTVDGGQISYTVYVWSDKKLIIVAADNNAQHPAPFRPTPFLTMDQLVAIGTNPALKEF